MSGSLHKSPIDKLDTPCLVRVLRHVSSQQQLVVCGAVFSKWRKATREAISSIHISTCTQKRCKQLQRWAVDPPAALYKLSLYGVGSQPSIRLQLSVLQHLKELELQDVFLEAIAADGSLLKVVDVLPRLQQCTKLTFHSWDNPELTAAVAAFQAMPALQDLELNCFDIHESLKSLPTTLTRLHLCDNVDALDTTSAATICQLTGLRVLEVELDGFDTSVLTNCADLEQVDISITSSLSSASGVAAPLLVFGNMPKLEHLQLRSGDADPTATAAEVAALSASSNLTYLSLSCSEYCALPPAAYDSWFPAGHQCPYLQHLDVGVWVLGNTAAVQRIVSACPGLQELDLMSSTQEDIQVVPARVAASLRALTNLTALTGLCVQGRDLPEGCCISPTVIRAWSHWTNLQHLELGLKYQKLEDLLMLSQLRSLRNLSIDGSDDGRNDSLEIQVLASGPSDVWCQLPAAVWGEVVRRKEKQVRQRLSERQDEQSRAATLLKRQKAAQLESASLAQQHATAVSRAATLQHEQAASQAKVAALLKQKAAEQAELAAVLQKQRQAEAAVLQQRLQEQQAELAATRQQADADRAQTAQLQGQFATLQATVTALLERQG